MTANEFKELLEYNEPSFGYRGKEYAICSPDGKFYVWSEDNPSDVQLVFEDVDDLLTHWIVHGERFRDIIPYIDFG